MKNRKIIFTLVGLTILVSCVNSNVRLVQKPSQVVPQQVANTTKPTAKPAARPIQVVKPVVVAEPEPIVVAEPETVVESAPVIETAQAPTAEPAATPTPAAKPVPETTEVAVVVVNQAGNTVKPRARPKTIKAKTNVVRPKPNARRLIDLAVLKPKKRKADIKKNADVEKKVTRKTANLRTTTNRRATAGVCKDKLARGIPRRSARAASGSAVVDKAMKLGGTERDNFVVAQLLDGNVPTFMRNLTPVTFTGRAANGKNVEVTICVTPDYLAVGDDNDFVRVPMGLPAAAKVANNFGFVLPTTKMVDAIYDQAGLRLSPNPMKPGSQMSSTAYLKQHNATVTGQRLASRNNSYTLVAGQKKDLVLSNVLRKTPGRVAIYGWHRMNGKPIQPLSTVHGKNYADYSHGIRLVSTTAYVNGRPKALADLLENPQMARIISKEGPISKPLSLMVALSTK